MSNSMQVMSSSASDEWYTPDWVFDGLHRVFQFTLDPCAINADVAKCPKFYSADNDGLAHSWENETVFCNPPHSDMQNWMRKFVAEAANGATTVALVPVRAGSQYWFKYVYPEAKEILIFKGRIKFKNSANSAPFDTCLILYGAGDFSKFESWSRRFIL